MLKLMKYELKGKFLLFSILIISMLLLNTGLVFLKDVWTLPICLSISILLAFGAWVILLIWCIGIFSKDLYEENGYLTYTLPQKGYSIVASKLIVSFVAFLLVAVISSLFIRYFATSITEITKAMDTVGVKVNSWALCIGGAAYYGFSFIELIVTIYFSIAVTRIAIAKKRAGKFAAFVVFVIINVIEGFATYFLAKLLPQEMYLQIFQSASDGTISNSVSQYDGSLNILTKGIPINISSLVLSIVLFIVFYIATSYIVENKIDL